MILHKLRFRGIAMPFRSKEVEIDFDALGDAKLVALVGGNGEGKTTCLELSGPATLFRTFPSYGESLADHVAPGVRDAFSELIFSIGGERYRALVQIDPHFSGGRGKSEAYLYQEVGSDWAPLAGPLVRDYDDAISRILPSRELFLASVFACQGGEGSFFGLQKAARKDLFGSLLGLAHLQEKSELARERARKLLERIDRVREDIAVVEQREGRVGFLDASIDEKRRVLAELERSTEEAREALNQAQAAHQVAKEALARAEAEAESTARDRQRLESERDRLHQVIGSLTGRLEEIAEILRAADGVRAAAEKLAEIESALEAARAKERELAEQRRPNEAQVVALSAQRTKLVEDHARTTKELESARAAQKRVSEAGSLEDEMTSRKGQLDEIAKQIAKLTEEETKAASAAKIEAQQISARKTLEARKAELAPRTGLLSKIPGVPECAACPLTADARRAKETLEQVEQELAELPEIEGTPAADDLAEIQKQLRQQSTLKSECERWIAENAPRLERLTKDRDEAAKVPALEAELERITSEGSAVRQQLDQAQKKGLELAAAHDAAVMEIGKLEDEKSRLAAQANRLPEIAKAEAQKAEVEASLERAKAEAMAARHALSQLPTHDLTPRSKAVADVSLVVAEKARLLNEAEAGLGQVRDELARLTGEREALGDPAKDLEELRRREADLVRDAADWTLLEKALGRDGVQALAIDAAGPTVSALANDLLSACYGPRFSLSLETTSLTKDGKKQREVFDVRILDAEAGREAKQGSGGEMILLEEGLRLGLAIFNAQRSGVPLRTLWRDETTGALSPENADKYIAMLRRAMELGGFERCLFVSHSPAVWSQADARIFIANGEVSFDDVRAAA